MNFISFQYGVFVLVVFALFVAVPSRFRWAVLLVASFSFYATLAAPYLLVTLAAVTVVSYASGMLIGRCKTESYKKRWMWAGIAANLSALLGLKYTSFMLANLELLATTFGAQDSFPASEMLASIGVSYYVFQGISYIIDVYYETLEPETHLGVFSLYMSFFPKLLQGPIERGPVLLRQLHDLQVASRDRIADGLRLFLWGVFKKAVIADRLATFVDPVYGDVSSHTGFPLLLATYLFAFQLYFDFSGYTDMALGIARCFNINLTPNFRSPYLAISISDFWRRWHISFSGWILDYIFKPLQFGYRDWGTWGTMFALMVTFLASGVWHGASWTFVAWGGIHGIYQCVGILLRPTKKKVYKGLGIEKAKWLQWLQIFVTFNLVSFSWIFFRASSMSDALYVAKNCLAGVPESIGMLSKGWHTFLLHVLAGKSTGETAYVAALLLFAAGIAVINARGKLQPHGGGESSWLKELPFWSRGIIYGILTYLIVFCGAATQSFIYLQF